MLNKKIYLTLISIVYFSNFAFCFTDNEKEVLAAILSKVSKNCISILTLAFAADDIANTQDQIPLDIKLMFLKACTISHSLNFYDYVVFACNKIIIVQINGKVLKFDNLLKLFNGVRCIIEFPIATYVTFNAYNRFYGHSSLQNKTVVCGASYIWLNNYRNNALQALSDLSLLTKHIKQKFTHE